MAEERKKSEITVESEGVVEKVVAQESSMKRKKKKNKKNREDKDGFAGEDGEIAAPEREKSGDDGVVKKKSKKRNKERKADSEAEDDGKKSKKKNKERKADSKPEEDVKKSKKKNKERKVDSEPEEDVKKSKKKNKERKADSEPEEDVKKSKKKNKEIKVDSEPEEGVKKSKERKVDSEADDDVGKSKKKKKGIVSDPEDGVKKSKKKSKELRDDDSLALKRASAKKSCASGTKGSQGSAPRLEAHSEDFIALVRLAPFKTQEEKESGGDEIGSFEENQRDEELLVNTTDAKRETGKRKRDDSDLDLGAEEHTEKSDEEVKRKSKKKKQNLDSEFEANNDSSKKEKNKKKKQTEDSEAEENSNECTEDAKKKRKKKQNCIKDVTTPSSKSTKKVKFSDQVEVFPTENEESEEAEEEEEEEVELVKGKRFTKEEDELIKKAVFEYIENHALGDEDEGLQKVLHCSQHPEAKGCWKEIESALPWRAPNSVYHRAHTIFEAGSQGEWTKEDYELLREYHKKHGSSDWRTLADAMGKHRKHVKDAWRRTRLNQKNKGNWSREEYQTLYDLVNADLRMKVSQEKHSKYGMLRDNIPWMAISDKLGTRDHTFCCTKWYGQLTSPMVESGTWANADDYRLMDELTKLDAACVDDVDWDNILEYQDGETCRKRWNQMVRHIGIPGTKTFAEQVDILSERYCSDLAEHRENFDNRPFDDV